MFELIFLPFLPFLTQTYRKIMICVPAQNEMCCTVLHMSFLFHLNSCSASSTHRPHCVWRADSPAGEKCGPSSFQPEVPTLPFRAAFWPARCSPHFLWTLDHRPLPTTRSPQSSSTSRWPQTRCVLGVHVCNATNRSLCEGTGIAHGCTIYDNKGLVQQWVWVYIQTQNVVTRTITMISSFPACVTLYPLSLSCRSDSDWGGMPWSQLCRACGWVGLVKEIPQWRLHVPKVSVQCL